MSWKRWDWQVYCKEALKSRLGHWWAKGRAEKGGVGRSTAERGIKVLSWTLVD